ncbi:MAG: EFR1 family ferrodoxin [Syntrophales bacterium]|jgi:NAD-dependent dihydropyrimidine dehydrogenase PreA subunit|nr:EFR1 family ferrodoxin [Syntrophales bacterium]MDY0045340.1 EFR1 family ferrodoxin [Syntrophales bacterium]
MKTDLFFYTGTGNSLWTARALARHIECDGIYPVSGMENKVIESRADAVGIIFPVHIWGLPRRIISFTQSLVPDPSAYVFAVAVNAGQVAATLLQLQKLMHARGLTLASGFDIVMPSNYIPWGGPGSPDERARRFNAAREKISKIADVVSNRKIMPVERGPLWQNILFSQFYKLSFRRVPAMDKSFYSDEKCDSCGICEMICPCGNISLKEGRPVWLRHCEQCLACIQWCPKEAIQFGKRTYRFERYHHPEIKLNDMIAISRKER